MSSARAFYSPRQKVHHRDVVEGILIPPSGERRIYCMTSKVQREMDAGGEVMGRFRDGRSSARVVLMITGGTLSRRRTIRGPWSTFVDTAGLLE